MRTLRITVSGQVYEVGVEILDEGPQPAAAPRSATRRGGASVGEAPSAPAAAPKAPAASGAVPSPLAGTVVSITVQPGQEVKSGDNLVVLEAMKMNTFVNATGDGVVKEILVRPGDAVEEGQGLLVMD